MRHDRRLYLILVLIALPFAGAGIDIYAPSLPALTQYFSASAETIKLSVTLYLLGLCFGQVVFGTASDFFGRRPSLILGLVGFVAFSWCITTAIDVHYLIFERLCQGFFMGSVAANSRSIVADIYNKDEIKHVSPYMSACWSIGPIIAPVIGGYLQYYFRWQLSFDVLATYALGLLLFVLYLEETNLLKRDFSLKEVLSTYGTVIRNPQYLGGLLAMAVGYFMLVIYAVILPFVVEYTLGKTAVMYGNVTLLLGASYLLGTLLNRFFQRYISLDMVIKRGMIVCVFSSCVMFLSLLLFPLNMFTLYVPIMLLTMAVGTVFPGCMSKCLSAFPEKAGIASALAGAGFMFFTAFMSTLMSYFHFKTALDLSEIFVVLSVLSLLIRWVFFVRPNREVTLV